MKDALIIATCFGVVCLALLTDGNDTNQAVDDVLHYRRREMNHNLKYVYTWHEITPSKVKYCAAKELDGVYVEIPMGATGLHAVSAVLVHYDKFSDHRNLLAFNVEKNIGLLEWDRWNSAALSLGSPDANEILSNNGFKCSALDVVRLLRLTYRD